MLLLSGSVFADVPGKYIVVFKDVVAHPEAIARQISQQHGLALGHIYQSAIKGFAAGIPEGKLVDVKGDPDVQYIVPDQIVSIPRDFGPGKVSGKGKTPSPQPAQALPTGVNRVNADLSNIALINGADERIGVDVAIIDTGIDKNHPDLNVVGGVNFASGRPNSFKDGHGHGTHVSGTVGALDNGIGVVGVAPGVNLWAVRVLDNNGSGFLSDVIAGIDWVAARSETIEVANMSLGWQESDTQNSPGHDAIRNAVSKGVVFTVAAGNSAQDVSNGFAPAGYSEVITVSAVADSDGQEGGLGPDTGYGDDDTFASFSNFGALVDIAAPGVDILSTFPGGTYGAISGTSMAAPHVAGVAALFIAVNGKPMNDLDAAFVRDQLVFLGMPQGSSGGFGGDPDAFAEPLVNAQF